MMDQLYQNTPYLGELQSQLGQRFSQIVATETRVFDQARNKLKEAGAKRKLEKLPVELRSMGAIIAGPLALPRGQTTEVPLLLRDPTGGLWQTARFALYTDPDGRWELVGIMGSQGAIRPAEEPKTYQPDDLSRANSEFESTLDGISKVSQAFVQHAQTNPVGQGQFQGQLQGQPQGQMPMQNQMPMQSQVVQSAPSGQSAQPVRQGSQSGSSSGSTSRNRRIPGSQSASSNAVVPAHNKEMTPKRMAKFMRQNRSNGLPEWARRLYMSRGRNKERWEEFAESIAIPCYNAVAGQSGFSELWQMMEQRGIKTGFFDQYHCYTKRQQINLNQQGQCTFASSCPAFQDSGDGSCVHQSVK